MEKQLERQKAEARLGKKLKFDKINWQKTIQRFNSYKPGNRVAILSTITEGLDKEHIYKPVGPETDPETDHIIIIVRGGVIIIIILHLGRKPRPVPGPDPVIMGVKDVLDKAINGKDTVFNRFSNSGVQHLIMDSPNSTIEIIANPAILKSVKSK